jgi:hypothetical protein
MGGGVFGPTEYIWIGGSGSDLRSKTKTLTKVPTNISELPMYAPRTSGTGVGKQRDQATHFLLELLLDVFGI